MFDFYKTYSGYSTTGLLKIIGQPTLYQPAAVEAAERLLSERNIQEHEQIQALQELAVEEYTAHQPHLLDKVQAIISSAFLYLFRPSTAFDVRKWNYWLCIGLGMYSAFAMINNVQFLLFVLRCDGCTFTSVELITVAQLVYIPLMIVLLLKQKHLGWMLVVAYCCYELISSVFALFLNWKHWQDQLPGTVISALLFGFLLHFLGKPRVVIFFKGSYSILRKTIIISTICCVMLWLWLVWQS